MAPVVHGLEAAYNGRVEFVYLDIDDPATSSFKRQLGYIYQPHIFLLDGEGNIVEQWVGLTSEGQLAAALSAISE